MDFEYSAIRHFQMKRVLIFISTFVAAVVILAADVSLSWDTPSDISDIAGYKIYYGGTSHGYTNVLQVGTVNTVTISNLPSTTLYFAGTTIVSNGDESGFSNEVKSNPTSTTNSLPSVVKDFSLVTVLKTTY